MFVPMPFLDLALSRWWARWVRGGRRPWARRVESLPGWALSYTFRYCLSVSLVFLLFTTLYTAAFFIVDVFAGEPAWKRWGITVGSVLVWALVSGVFLAMLAERVKVSETLLIRRSWRGLQRVEWSSIEWVTLGGDSDALVFRRRDGGTIRVSLFLDGLWSLEPYLVSRFGPEAAGGLVSAFPPRG